MRTRWVTRGGDPKCHKPNLDIPPTPSCVLFCPSFRIASDHDEIQRLPTFCHHLDPLSPSPASQIRKPTRIAIPRRHRPAQTLNIIGPFLFLGGDCRDENAGCAGSISDPSHWCCHLSTAHRWLVRPGPHHFNFARRHVPT